jgi:hypothetical protein
VTVTGVNDDVVDGNIEFSMIAAAATSTDTVYHAIDVLGVDIVTNDGKKY